MVSSGVTAKGTFGISHRSQAHIMTILRDTLYSDKILAVLREYGSNAWDAHRMVGKNDLPIQITLPETNTPTLVIRDFGPGMTPDDVFNIYTQYGESTKRGTDDAVGMMGIGSKSAFAYSDSFTVTSWNGGMKRVYVAVLDASNIGEIQCLDETPCDPDETGIEIQVPVRIHDLYDFRTKASNLFRYFDPQPEINIALPKIDRKHRDNGFVSSDLVEWIAVMGCIPYRLNLTQVQNELEEEGLWKPLQRIKGGLHFKIGEVNISASREELKYTDYTKKAIVAKFAAMIDEHIEEALRDIKDANLSDWDKRVKSNFMAHVIGFKLPKGFTEWSRQSVELWGYQTTLEDAVIAVTDGIIPDSVKVGRHPAPTTFTLFNGRRDDQAVNNIQITQGASTRFVIKDDPRSMKGFAFNTYDYIVRPLPDVEIDDVRAELTAYITKAKLTGVPITTVTEAGIGWNKPWEPEDDRKPKRVIRLFLPHKNPKYWTKPFKLKDFVQNVTSHHSLNWEPAQWEASDADVYVLLENFEPKSFGHGANFYGSLAEDKDLAKWMGLTMPPIYGYKDTVTSPVNMKKVKGTEYTKWRVKFFTDAVANSPTVTDMIELMSWAIVRNGNYLSDYYTTMLTNTTKKFGDLLGTDHMFTTTLDKMAKANAAAMRNRSQIKMIERVIKITDPGSESKNVMATLEAAYPLIFKVTDIFHLESMMDEWIAYIKVCDDAKAYRVADAMADEILALDAANNDDLDALVEEIAESDDSMGLLDRQAA